MAKRGTLVQCCPARNAMSIDKEATTASWLSLDDGGSNQHKYIQAKYVVCSRLGKLYSYSYMWAASIDCEWPSPLTVCTANERPHAQMVDTRQWSSCFIHLEEFSLWFFCRWWRRPSYPHEATIAMKWREERKLFSWHYESLRPAVIYGRHNTRYGRGRLDELLICWDV